MRFLARMAILALALGLELWAPSTLLAQDSKETGTVTGRVLLDGKPAQGVIVTATFHPIWSTDPTILAEQMLKPAATLKAVTDSDGRYRFEAVPSGRYSIAPSAPTLVSAQSEDARQLTITEGVTLEDINFSLSRGGVITGKVTDSDGNPVIAEQLSLKLIDSPKSDASTRLGERMYFTDDRGIYRIYGLAPGKYIVSTGTGSNPITSLLARRPKRARTFYPGVTDEAKAKPVEVSAGAEASGVDIKLGMIDKGFTVSGRVLAAETGTPIANAMIAYSPKPRESKQDSEPRDAGIPGGITTTNAKGEFRIDSVSPGSYKLDVESLGALTGGSVFYADPFNFEVQSANVDKLEIKVHLGASISGVVVVENAGATPTTDGLTSLMLMAQGNTPSGSHSMGRVAADGTFRMGGLKAGKTIIHAIPIGIQKFSILRIEYNGAEQSEGLEIQENEQITGVRIVLTEANCVIRGHVTIQGGTLSPESEMFVWARPINGTALSNRSGVDGKGNFVLENLVPGDYEIEVTVNVQGSGGGRRVSAKQSVSLVNGTPSETNLVLDLGKDK